MGISIYYNICFNNSNPLVDIREIDISVIFPFSSLSFNLLMSFLLVSFFLIKLIFINLLHHSGLLKPLTGSDKLSLPVWNLHDKYLKLAPKSIKIFKQKTYLMQWQQQEIWHLNSDTLLPNIIAFLIN